jgi:SAM-dependent methyltransferase
MTPNTVAYWWDRLIRSFKLRGVWGTAERMCSYAQMFLTPAGRRERRFDYIHGVQTSGRLALYELGIETPNLVYSAEYRPTPVRAFLRIVAGLGIDYRRWIFVDLGAGKGRALLLACQFPFKAVIGVEFSPELAEVAQTNLARSRDMARSCDKTTVICGDASTYALPLEPAVIYLNNPFHGPVMERVVENLRISLDEHPRDLRVIYWNPACARMFDQVPFLINTHRNTQYCVYQSRLKKAAFASETRLRRTGQSRNGKAGHSR